MKVLDVLEMSKGRKKGQRRIDLFRRENLETWILCFPPGDVQVMHNHPSDRTYYVLTGKGIIKGRNETHEVTQGQIISIPAHEFYEGSNPNDEPMMLARQQPQSDGGRRRQSRRPTQRDRRQDRQAGCFPTWRRPGHGRAGRLELTFNLHNDKARSSANSPGFFLPTGTSSPRKSIADTIIDSC